MIRRMKLTGEYVGGLLAGSGIGIELCGYFVVGDPLIKNLPWFMGGMMLIAIGTTIAASAQKRVVIHSTPENNQTPDS